MFLVFYKNVFKGLQSDLQSVFLTRTKLKFDALNTLKLVLITKQFNFNLT